MVDFPRHYETINKTSRFTLRLVGKTSIGEEAQFGASKYAGPGVSGQDVFARISHMTNARKSKRNIKVCLALLWSGWCTKANVNLSFQYG